MIKMIRGSLNSVFQAYFTIFCNKSLDSGPLKWHVYIRKRTMFSDENIIVAPKMRKKIGTLSS